MEFNPSEVATLIEQHGVAYVKDLFAAANVRPAGFGLPTDWRGTEEKWRAGTGDAAPTGESGGGHRRYAHGDLDHALLQ